MDSERKVKVEALCEFYDAGRHFIRGKEYTVTKATALSFHVCRMARIIRETQDLNPAMETK